jgi:hypothetical protein
VYQQYDIIPNICPGIIDTGGNLRPLSTTQVVLVTKCAVDVVDTGGKFDAVVIDIGAKFATGVVDTGGAPSFTCKYLREFLEKFEMTIMLF